MERVGDVLRYQVTQLEPARLRVRAILDPGRRPGPDRRTDPLGDAGRGRPLPRDRRRVRRSVAHRAAGQVPRGRAARHRWSSHDRVLRRAGPPDASRPVPGRVRALPHPLTPYDELIVNFCPTGMIPTKAMTPHVPVSPAEVVEQACQALDRGIAIVHLHARDGGRHADVPGADLRGDDPRHPGRASRRDHVRELQRPELPRVRAAERGAGADRRGAARPREPHAHQSRLSHRDQPERSGHGHRAGREDGGARGSSRSWSASTTG